MLISRPEPLTGREDRMVKKKAYQRFGDLTRRAMEAPTAADEAGDGGADEDADLGAYAGPFSIQLDPELRRDLEQRAAATRKTPSEILEEALRRYLRTFR
jgi:hypothetical protein